MHTPQYKHRPCQQTKGQFIVVPLTAGWLTRTLLLKSRGKDWFEKIPAEVSSGDDLVTVADAGADLRVPGRQSDEEMVRRSSCWRSRF